MTKPIWELEPEEIGEEMARPNKRVPRSTELTRLEERLAALPVSEPGGVDDAFAEFDSEPQTMFTPSAWPEPPSSEMSDSTEITRPSNAANAGPAAEGNLPFSPPTAKISRDELEKLRAQLKGAGKK